MLLKLSTIRAVAHELADDFSKVVGETGTLTYDQMRVVIHAAWKKGRVPNLASERSLRLVNEEYASR